MKRNKQVKSGITWSMEASPELVQAYANRLISRRKRMGLSQRDLAKMVEVSVNTIQSYESGFLPRGEHFVNLARALHCSLDWLVGLNGGGLSWPTTCENEALNAIGQGGPNWEAPRSWVYPPYLEEPGIDPTHMPPASVSFERNWLSMLVPDPNNARLLTVRGPSMQPTFVDGDHVLVDIGMTQVYQGQIYVISIDGYYMINRLETRPGGIYRVISDNTAIAPPYEIEANKVTVVGKIAWNGRSVR